MIITIIIIILLFTAQLLFILNSQTQIRYEDLAESVRNVFWLEQGLVYDGVSSNVGWYGTLLLIYKLFGFYLHGAQFFKLVLYSISMLCLGLLLRKYVKHFWLPWLMIGLSPTLLYYTTSQTSHGIDLLYFPIVLFLVLGGLGELGRLGGWMVAMWAWMSYPTFIFYLPALIFFHLRGGKLQLHLGGVLIRLVAFLTPLALVFFLVQNRSLLLYDPQINSGIFRGAGGIDLSLDNFSHNLGGLVTDLFSSGKSYHFEVNQAEFSLFFPALALVFVVGISLRGFKYNNYNYYKHYTILALVLLAAVLVVSSLTLDPSGHPGIRRYTPALAAFYGLFVIAWGWTEGREIRGIWGIRVILGLLLIHHLVVFPINLAHLKDLSPNKEPLWFSRLESPQKSFDSLVETVQKEDLKLVCLDQSNKPFYCRISEVYAAVAGACLWNNLECNQILGSNPKMGQLIPLSTKLWDEYIFEH